MPTRQTDIPAEELSQLIARVNSGNVAMYNGYEFQPIRDGSGSSSAESGDTGGGITGYTLSNPGEGAKSDPKLIYSQFDTSGHYQLDQHFLPDQSTANFMVFLGGAFGIAAIGMAMAGAAAAGSSAASGALTAAESAGVNLGTITGADAGAFWGGLDGGATLGGGASINGGAALGGGLGADTFANSLADIGDTSYTSAAADSQAANADIAANGGNPLEGYTTAGTGTNPVIANGLPNGTGGGTDFINGAFQNTNPVFNAAQDSQLANEAIQAGYPGFEQFGGDALSGYLNYGPTTDPHISNFDPNGTGSGTDQIGSPAPSPAGAPTSTPSLPPGAMPPTGSPGPAPAPSTAGGLDLSGLISLLSGMYGMNQQQQSSTDMLNWLNGQQAKIDHLYDPNTPEYNSLWDEMSRKDAAAGRNSQYGPRSVDLAARIAQVKADNTAKLTTGIGNTYAAALNRGSTAGANLIPGLQSLFGNGTPTQAALNSWINSILHPTGTPGPAPAPTPAPGPAPAPSTGPVPAPGPSPVPAPTPGESPSPPPPAPAPYVPWEDSGGFDMGGSGDDFSNFWDMGPLGGF